VNALAIVVALAASVCFAFNSALQHRAASQEPRAGAMDPRLVFRLLRRPMWLAGSAADIAGVALQAVALGIGALIVIEPVLASSLFLAVPLEAALGRRTMHRRDLAGATIATLGLAAFLLAANPGGGVRSPSDEAWFGTGAAIVAVAVGVLALARRAAAYRRVTFLGLACGLTYGVTAGLLKSCAEIAARHPLGLFTSWQLYAIMTLGAAAFALNQNAFQGRMTAPLIAMSLADPVVGVILGLMVFHEHLAAGGGRGAVVGVAAVAMVVGTWLAGTAGEIGSATRTADASGADQAAEVGHALHAFEVAVPVGPTEPTGTAEPVWISATG
jgi:drug/metabolite transporter (DMT)-like permease